MIIAVIAMVVLLILFLTIHVFLLHTGTQIGEKGHRYILLQNLICIVEAMIVLSLSWVWAAIPESGNRIYALAAAAIGIVLLISGIIGIKSILKESPDDLITEDLSDIRIVPAGYHNQDRKLEGVSNGTHSWFMLRGADKALAQRIKDSGRNHVRVVYHSSNRRIESISL